MEKRMVKRLKRYLRGGRESRGMEGEGKEKVRKEI